MYSLWSLIPSVSYTSHIIHVTWQRYTPPNLFGCPDPIWTFKSTQTNHAPPHLWLPLCGPCYEYRKMNNGLVQTYIYMDQVQVLISQSVSTQVDVWHSFNFSRHPFQFLELISAPCCMW